MFGQGMNPGFGAAATTTAAPAFGATPTPTFGSAGTQGTFGQSSGSSFGSGAGTNPPAYGSLSGGSAFGNAPTFNNPSTTSTSSFGSATSNFGTGATTSAPMFGSGNPGTSGFGSGSSVFGTSNAFAPVNTFGSATTTTTTTNVSGFGSASTGSSGMGTLVGAPAVFGSVTSTSSGTASGFGSVSTSKGSSGFGALKDTAGPGFGAASTIGSSVFGQSSDPTGSMFGSSTTVSTASSNIFGGSSTSTTKPSIFGNASASTATGIFGLSNKAVTTTATFGGATNVSSSTTFPSSTSSETKPPPVFSAESSTFGVTSSSLFGNQGTSVFGGSSDVVSSVFGAAKSAAQAALDQSTASSEAATAPVRSILKSLVEEEEGEDSGTQVTVLFGKNVRTRSPSPSSQDGPGSPERRKRIIRRTRDDPLTSAGQGLFRSALSRVKRDREDAESTEGSEQQDPSSAPRSPARRRTSLEDVSAKVAIVCRNVPPEWNNKAAIRKHFSKYGVVRRVYPNLAKQTCIVHFENHEQAEAALRKGKQLKPNLRITIFWSSHIPKGASSENLAGGPRSSASLDTLPRPLGTDLDDELSSMTGPADVQAEIIQPRGPRQVAPRLPDERRRRGRPDEAKVSSGSGVTGASVGAASKDGKKATARADGAGTVSMKALVGSVGHTSEERYEILNSRDKIIKSALGGSKQADLATSTVTRGTCPDMCPEKERYMREYRRHLHVYEMVQGTDVVDHARAVKEYSRSSADQDAALPNELRPPAVLERTMDYLVSHIMDRGGEGRWADWYEFLWSRTRSIRKDITQQQLCDLSAVSVTEKNVRFHVYCSERLSEEDARCFDQKINNENLTKCLQTLKELYGDLEKRGQACPNEGEFRAYMVLMNLNEGDVLREVQQLRPELRHSDPVRFATTVHSAMNTNNYVRFFKLLGRAPYLYACIMHRYFGQVRSKALHTIVRAYRWAETTPQYPLSELVPLLGFEDVPEAAVFCQHHGLATTDTHVAMDRGRFVYPETALEARRAVRLIESKLNTSVGEAVNGGPLPPHQLPQPASSFDSSGRYVGVEVAGPQESGAEAPTQPPAPQLSAPPPLPAPVIYQPPRPQEAATAPGQTASEGETTAHRQTEIYPNEAIKEIAKGMFIEVIKEQVMQMSSALVHSIQTYLNTDADVYETIERDTVNREIRSVCTEVYSDSRRELSEHQARHKAEVSALRASASVAVGNGILGAVVMEMCDVIAEEEYSSVIARRSSESQLRVTSALTSDLLAVAIQEGVVDVAEEVFEADVVARLERLEDARRATQVLVMARFWRRWRNKYAALQRLKRSIHTFPSGPALAPPRAQLARLLPDSRGIIHDNALSLGPGTSVTLEGAPRVLEREVKLRYDATLYNYWRLRRHEKARQPLNLGDGFYKSLLTRVVRTHRGAKAQGPLYWKLVLSLPDVGPDSSLDDDYAQRTVTACDWLRAKFRKGTVPNPDLEAKSELLSLYTCPVSSAVSPRGRLAVCVRVMRGFPDEDEADTEGDRQRLLGTTAVLFYVGEAGPGDRELYLSEVESRLQHVLESLPKSRPVPLIVVTSRDSPVTTATDLSLGVYVDEGMVSEYRVITLGRDTDDEECNNELSDGVSWAADHYPPPPGLASEPLRTTIEDTLQREFFSPVYETLCPVDPRSVDPRPSAPRRLSQPPALLVAAYNHVIAHVRDAVTQEALVDVSWPVPEFSTEASSLPAADWNTPARLAALSEFLLDLELPEYDSLLPGDTDDTVRWTDALDDVWGYVGAVAEDGQSNTQLFSKVRWLLRKVEREFSATCHTCLRLDDCQPTAHNVPWTDILLACVESRLGQANWSDGHTQAGGELMAHYFPATLRGYRPPREWLDTVLDVTQTDIPSLDETLLRSAKRKRNASQQKPSPPKVQRLDLSSMETSSVVPGHLDLSVISEIQQTADSAAHRLRNLVAAEKQHSRNFEDFLQRSLLEDDSMLGPVFQQSFGSPQIHATVERTSFSHLHKNQQSTPTARVPVSRSTPRGAVVSTPRGAVVSTPRGAMFRTPLAKDALYQTPTETKTSTRLPLTPAHPGKTSYSLETDLEDLNLSLNSLRRSDIIYEMRLKSFLTDS